jgi:hypothetical protein
VALRIAPYSKAYAAGTARLNARLRDAQVDPGLRLPVDGPDEGSEFDAEPTLPLVKRQFLLVDNGDVRGGFILQEQQFEVAGTIQWVANIQTPISEGVVDRRFALVAPKMLSLLLERKPLVFAVGMGGRLDQPFARLVSTLKWPTARVPFAFYVIHPARFLRNINVGRHTAIRALTRVAAWSGVGWLGVRCVHQASGAVQRLGRRPPQRLTTERITDWGEWTDAVWTAYRAACSFAAIRDCGTLPQFHPLSHQPLHAYRCVGADGREIGWVALQMRAMKQNPYFGDMRVATVLDAVAVPGWEDSVMTVVTRLATEAGADLIVSNQQHHRWRQAQWRTGFLEGPSNYLLALSPQLAAALHPLEQSFERLHVTRADGDGRVSL